jgi:tetratricopeptide (TPR) repeat protein
MHAEPDPATQRILTLFEQTWQYGSPPRVEDFLRDSSVDRGTLLRELVKIDLKYRLKAGEKVSVDDYLRRFPALQANAGDPIQISDGPSNLLKKESDPVAESQKARKNTSDLGSQEGVRVLFQQAARATDLTPDTKNPSLQPVLRDAEVLIALPVSRAKRVNWQAKVPSVANRLLLLLLVMLIGRLLLGYVSDAIVNAPSLAALAGAFVGTLALFAWPIVVCLWLRATLRPALLPPASFSVMLMPLLQVPTYLGIVFGLMLGGTKTEPSLLSALVYPPNIALQVVMLTLAVVLSFRSWRVYRELKGGVRGEPSLPRPMQAQGATLAWMSTILFALVAVGFGSVSGVSSLKYPGGFSENLARRLEYWDDPRLARGDSLFNSGTGRLKSDPQVAENELREAIFIYESLEPNHPQAQRIRRNTLQARCNLGIALFSLARFQGCIEEARKAVALSEAQGPPDETNLDVRRICLHNIASSLTKMGRFQESMPAFRSAQEAYSLQRIAHGLRPHAQVDCANCDIEFALACMKLNDTGSAYSLLREAAVVLRKVPADADGRAEAQENLARAQQDLQQHKGAQNPAANGLVPKEVVTKNIVLVNDVAKLHDELTEADGTDKVKRRSFCKAYTVELMAGKIYRIDMTANQQQLNPFLRLEFFAGAELAFDDDSGGDLNARIVFVCTTSGKYRVIATTSEPAMTGPFTLTMKGAPDKRDKN